MIWETAAQAILTLFGLGGLLYAFLFERVSFNLLNSLPSPINQRKAVFLGGAMLILLSFALSYWIAPYHGFIGAVGGWIMLLGSSQWFTLRIERKVFATVEIRIIRKTMFTGLVIAVLSSGFLMFPNRLSLATLFLGFALMSMAGRLWWKEDSNYDTMVMSHSKRDYS